jgi:hypothetical protein
MNDAQRLSIVQFESRLMAISGIGRNDLRELYHREFEIVSYLSFLEYAENFYGITGKLPENPDIPIAAIARVMNE